MVGEANKVLDQRQKEIRRVLSELKIAQRESEKLDVYKRQDEEVLLAATGADDYYYCLHALDPIKQTPYETTLFFEKDPSYNSIPRESNKNGVIPLDLKSPYRSLLDMHYSGTNLFLGSDPEAGWLLSLIHISA